MTDNIYRPYEAKNLAKLSLLKNLATSYIRHQRAHSRKTQNYYGMIKRLLAFVIFKTRHTTLVYDLFNAPGWGLQHAMHSNVSWLIAILRALRFATSRPHRRFLHWYNEQLPPRLDQSLIVCLPLSLNQGIGLCGYRSRILNQTKPCRFRICHMYLFYPF